MLKITAPVQKLTDPGNTLTVILHRCPTETNRVDLIKCFVICPHKNTCFLYMMMSELKILNDACLVPEKDRVYIRQEHSQKNYITGRQVEESK